MIPSDFEVPSQWNEINIERLTGTVMVIGSPDSGKSTMVHWLFNRLCQIHSCVGWLDGDIGQTSLGVPTTINLALSARTIDFNPYLAATFFIGNTSPRGHMNQLLDGLQRLQKIAMAATTAALVIDTTGLIDENGVGNVIKRKKIELLKPNTIIALKHGQELEHLITFLKTEQRYDLHVINASEFVVRKSPEQRTRRRSARFRRYFQSSVQHRIKHDALPVSGPPPLINSLMAFQDKMGFALALGVVISISSEMVDILTPLADLSEVAGLRFCALRIDPPTGEEL